jgi:hypothetical protein
MCKIYHPHLVGKVRKMKLALTLLLLVLITGCTTQRVCTEDAMLCPDGTAVGRDANNNCEFFACSNETPIPVEPDGGIGLTNPYVQYVGYDRAQCAATDWICIEGSSQFFDDSGCGCKADEPRKYISNSTDECSRIRYMCTKNYIPFSDEDGCGCEFTFYGQGKVQAIDCTDPRPEICTKEYMPVCGQVQVECIRAPCNPVMQTFGNKCEACANSRTISYFEGACPANECTCPEGYRKDGEACNPECYYSQPKCLTPSIMCETELK